MKLHSQALRLLSSHTKELLRASPRRLSDAVHAPQSVSEVLVCPAWAHCTPRRTVTTKIRTIDIPEAGSLTLQPQPSGPRTNKFDLEAQWNSLSLSDNVRLLMRHVPHPVAIITATDLNALETDRGFRGMTVSSFNTVTLTPEPVVSFNVRRPSETLNALVSSGRFLVHLLAPTRAAAALAREFSKGNANLSLTNGTGEFEFASYWPAEVEPVPVAEGSANGGEAATAKDHISLPPHILPLLRRRIPATTSRPDVVGVDSSTKETPVGDADFSFVFECRYLQRDITVYDHTIVLGAVVRTIRRHDSLLIGQEEPGKGDEGNGKASTACSPRDLCLAYADTRFWKMGPEI